jgi:prepilin-type processing-associated H-X9-DG protein
MMITDSYPGYLVYCAVCWPIPPGVRASDPTNRVPVNWPPANFYTAIHNEGVNIAFVDGHVKWQRASTLIVLPAAGTQQRVDFEILWGHRLK